MYKKSSILSTLFDGLVLRLRLFRQGNKTHEYGKDALSMKLATLIYRRPWLHHGQYFHVISPTGSASLLTATENLCTSESKLSEAQVGKQVY